MAAPPEIAAELKILRDDVARLRRQVHNSASRVPQLTFPKYLRAAKTWSDEEVSYPSSATKEYPFVFCDLDFSPGTGELTWVARDDEVYPNRCIMPQGLLLPKGTGILIAEAEENVWLVAQDFRHATRGEGTLHVALESGSPAEVNVTSWMDGQAPEEFDTENPLSVQNRFGWEGDLGAKVHIEHDWILGVWFLTMVECPDV